MALALACSPTHATAVSGQYHQAHGRWHASGGQHTAHGRLQSPCATANLTLWPAAWSAPPHPVQLPPASPAQPSPAQPLSWRTPHQLNKTIMAAGCLDELQEVLEQHHQLLMLHRATPQHSCSSVKHPAVGALDAINLSALAARLVQLCGSQLTGARAAGMQAQLQDLLPLLCELCAHVMPGLRPRQHSTLLWALHQLCVLAGLSQQAAGGSSAPHAVHDMVQPVRNVAQAPAPTTSAPYPPYGPLPQHSSTQSRPPSAPPWPPSSGPFSPEGSQQRQPLRMGRCRDGRTARLVRACMGCLAIRLCTSPWLGESRVRVHVQALHALAKAQLHPGDPSHIGALLGAMCDDPGANSHLSRANPQDLSMAIYALALLRHPPPPAWLHAFWAASGQVLAASGHVPGGWSHAQLPFEASLSPQALANVAWALATLGCPLPAAWLRLLLRAAGPHVLTRMEDQEIGSIAWALPRLVCQAQRPCVTQLHHRAEAWPTADSAQPRSLACTWLASVESELGARWVGLPDRDNPPPGYSWGSGAGGGERASPGSSSSRHEPTAQTTVSVVRAMALLQHTPSAPFLGAMWAHVQRDLLAGDTGRSGAEQGKGRGSRGSAGSGWAGSVHAKCSLLWALGMLRLDAPQALIEAVTESLGAQLQSCAPVDLASAIQALAVLHHTPSVKWTVRFFEATRQLTSACSMVDLAVILVSVAKLRLRPKRAWMEWILQETASRMYPASATSSPLAQPAPGAPFDAPHVPLFTPGYEPIEGLVPSTPAAAHVAPAPDALSGSPPTSAIPQPVKNPALSISVAAAPVTIPATLPPPPPASPDWSLAWSTITASNVVQCMRPSNAAGQVQQAGAQEQQAGRQGQQPGGQAQQPGDATQPSLRSGLSPSVARQCTSGELAMLWAALGQLGYCPSGAWAARACACAIEQLHAFSGGELAMVVKAQAKLGLVAGRPGRRGAQRGGQGALPASWPTALQAALAGRMYELPADELYAVMRGMATLQGPSPADLQLGAGTEPEPEPASAASPGHYVAAPSSPAESPSSCSQVVSPSPFSQAGPFCSLDAAGRPYADGRGNGPWGQDGLGLGQEQGTEEGVGALHGAGQLTSVAAKQKRVTRRRRVRTGSKGSGGGLPQPSGLLSPNDHLTAEGGRSGVVGLDSHEQQGGGGSSSLSKQQELQGAMADATSFASLSLLAPKWLVRKRDAAVRAGLRRKANKGP